MNRTSLIDADGKSLSIHVYEQYLQGYIEMHMGLALEDIWKVE